MANTPTYGASSAGAAPPPGTPGSTGDSWNSLTDNPIGHFLFGNPATGYDTAAQGAMAASNGFQDLGNWNWNTAMGGLGQAQGAYNPSNALWYSTYGNQGPNAMDTWWGQNQGQFGAPTATQGAMGQYQSYMGQPTAASGAYAAANSALGGMGNASDYYSMFGGQMQNQSGAERAYNPMNYSSPGAGENFYSQAQGMLGNTGRTEDLSYQNTGNMQNFAQSLPGQQGQGATTAGAGEIGGYYRGANDVSNYAQGQMGQLSGPGAYEQYVQSDINGTNPQLQRETDQGLARINQEMARRGGFNSGAASTSIGNFLGEEAAKDYQNRADRAQSAQQMELSRIGAGSSLSQASAQGKLAQGSALQSLAGQTDAEKLARLQQQMSAEQGASSESLANSAGRLNYAQAGDQNELARAQALGGFANMSQQDQLARLAGGMNAAGQSDQGFMNRTNAGYGMAQGADQSALARYMGLNSMAQGADQGTLARYGMLGGLAGQQDQGSLARLMGSGAMAGNVAGMDQNQLNAMFNSRMGLDSANAGLIGQFYGAGMQGYNTSQTDALNALANYYGLMGQGQGANAAMPLQLAGLAVKGYAASQGKPT